MTLVSMPRVNVYINKDISSYANLFPQTSMELHNLGSLTFMRPSLTLTKAENKEQYNCQTSLPTVRGYSPPIQPWTHRIIDYTSLLSFPQRSLTPRSLRRLGSTRVLPQSIILRKIPSSGAQLYCIISHAYLFILTVQAFTFYYDHCKECCPHIVLFTSWSRFVSNSVNLLSKFSWIHVELSNCYRNFVHLLSNSRFVFQLFIYFRIVVELFSSWCRIPSNCCRILIEFLSKCPNVIEILSNCCRILDLFSNSWFIFEFLSNCSQVDIEICPILSSCRIYLELSISGWFFFSKCCRILEFL